MSDKNLGVNNIAHAYEQNPLLTPDNNKNNISERKQKKQKHNYTSELELKSLLIRIKNKKKSIGSTYLNTRINKYIKWHTAINSKKYDVPAKRNKLKAILKERIVRDSELTCIDQKSYERFGKIILLMVKNILKKPQFCGYTYRDDFYSDAVYKILKYLHNFDHKMISKRTGTPVNSFAYISQYIHNSILFIINTKKKELDRLKHQVAMANLDHNLQIHNHELINSPSYIEENVTNIDNENTFLYEIDEISVSLYDEIKNIPIDVAKYERVDVLYPKEYRITFDEYNELKDLLKGKISIVRKK